MTVDGLYWDEAGRADVGMIEPGDTVYCICRGADGLFSVSSGVCVDPPVRFTSATARSSSASPRRSSRRLCAGSGSSVPCSSRGARPIAAQPS